VDRPRLRNVEAFPVQDGGKRYLGLRDPAGLADGSVVLTEVGVAILQLCDGARTREEICAEFTRRYRAPLERSTLDSLIDRLDDGGFLDSSAFRARAAEVLAGFLASPIRAAHLAGRSYPGDPAELTILLDSFFEGEGGPGAPTPFPAPLPRAIIAPHIDFHRGGPAYAWAYHPLGTSQDRPDLVVVFGTDHQGAEPPFTLTRKHYDTPLGRLVTDLELVGALARELQARCGESAAARLFEHEHHHRTEHSIEFQMVWLRHVWRDTDAPRVLPILCGPLHQHVSAGRSPAEDREVAAFCEALRTLVSGRRVLWIAGADLSHVGPQFGDPAPLSDPERRRLEVSDRQALGPAEGGDAAGWFHTLSRARDRTRVCGLGPIYALLETARPGAGEVRAYGQCPADPEAGSVVSIASVVYG
jgi:AmmeMemoRadiSam system protein B